MPLLSESPAVLALIGTATVGSEAVIQLTHFLCYFRCVILHCKQMFHGWSLHLTVHVHQCLLQNRLDIVVHLKDTTLAGIEVQRHPKVIMHFSTRHNQWCDLTVLLIEDIDDLCVKML
jgi:hypothetical protein